MGAGTGLIFLLRWFWWRINAWSEISAMIVSFAVALYFQFGHAALGFTPPSASLALVLGVAITTVGWLSVTFLTPPTERAALQRFYDTIRPPGRSWQRIVDTGGRTPDKGIAVAFLCWFLGCMAVYTALFGTGYLLYGRAAISAVCFAGTIVSGWWLFRLLPRVRFD